LLAEMLLINLKETTCVTSFLYTRAATIGRQSTTTAVFAVVEY